MVGSDGFVGDIDHLTIYNYLLPLPTLVGDLNGDGKVDINDYNIIKSDFGKVGTPGFIPDDINKNGKVDIFDYTILVTAMGSFTPAPSSAPTPIPAPSVTPTPTPTSTPSIPAAVTLYKLVRKTSQNALYTIYTSERDAAITSGGWILGTSTFKVWNTQSDPALVPLYRLHTNADFFYTTSTSESDYAKTIGYTYDGPVFFVYPSAKAGTIPVYRLVGSGYHVYTASSTELSTYQASGFRNEGVTFYAASP